MLGLLICLAALQLADGSCPEGFDLVRDGECRGSMATMRMGRELGTLKAIEMCDSIHAKPIIIHNDEHQFYWKAQAPRAPGSLLYIGLVCNTLSKKWEWSDGTVLDYRPTKGYKAELDKPCTPDGSWDIQADGFWSHGDNGDLTGYIACTKQLEPLIPSGNGCDSDGESGACYLVTANTASALNARSLCEEVGGRPASIHNLSVNSLIRQLAVEKGAMNGVSIGVVMYNGMETAWEDGSAWDYDHYYPGFPKYGFGYCMAMDTTSPSGQWMNIDCETQLPAACIRPEHAIVKPSCNSEFWDWNEGQIITSPEYPFNASTPCDYFLKVQDGMKVELEIMSLEANSCCDSLVIYDGYLGGSVIANITGDVHDVRYLTVSSNIMRVSWRPEGGVNVK